MNVVVTGGGTVAPIDDVRSIANASSGRLSAGLTEAFLRRGAAVWHVHAPSSQLPLLRQAAFDLDAQDPAAEHARLDALRDAWAAVRGRLHLVPLRDGTVADYAATLRRVLTERAVDLAVLAMAVSDYEPDPVPGKIDSEARSLTIRVRRTPKVIRSVRDWAPDVFLTGFKLLSRADTSTLIQAAEESCRTNRADLTFANDLQTLRQGRHQLHLVRPGAAVETLGPGADLADRLVERLVALAATRREGR